MRRISGITAAITAVTALLLVLPIDAQASPNAARAATHDVSIVNNETQGSETNEFPRGFYFPVDVSYKNSKGSVVFQSDGNFVVYDQYGRGLWASGTRNLGKVAVVQWDGNFVIYDGFGNGVWASGTRGTGYTMFFQSDGNLVLFNLANEPIWASNTSH